MTTSTVASPTMAPQDLPHDNAQFIAFGPEVRVADPMGGEDPVTLRPQVYVQFWPGIKIKEIKDGGMNGDKNDLVTIHFDPESVGLSKPISAHMDANDPLVNIIRERFAAGEPVTAAIEVVRKKSNSATKAPIDLHIPIHALRGAEHPDGAGDGRAMVGPSGDNCRKIVSLINGRTSKTIVSDPREWKHLVSNKTGNIPPEGWRYYAPGDDWKQVGAIIAKATAAAPAGPSPRDTTQSAPPATQASGEQVSAESLRAVVQVAVQDALAQSDQERGEAYGGRSSVRGRFDEGKKWDARTNDGRVNLGSYLVGNTGWAFRWAFTHLTSLLEGETPEDATVWALTERLLDMSDAVQAEAYGRGVEPDRTAASHTVATQWVEWVVEHHDLPYPHLGDEMAIEVWSKSVATQAAAVLAGAGANVGAYLSSKSKAAKDRARTAPAEPPQPTGPSPKLVRGLLDTLGRSWDNREVIGTLGRQVQERNMGPVEVGITDSESAAPSFSYPPADGATTAALDTVLRTRYQALARAEGAVHPVSPTSPASPVPTQASAASPTTPAPPQAAEPTSGYTPQIAAIVQALHNSSDLDSLRAVYLGVKDDGLLGEPIWVKPSPVDGLTYGERGQRGFTERTLAQAMEHLRKHFEASASPTVTEPVPTAPEPVPTAPEPTAPEPSAAPVTAEAEESDPFAEPTDSKEAHAQNLADRTEAAAAAKDVAQIDALIQEATENDLGEVKVQVGTLRGPLRALQNNRRKKAAQS